MKPSKPILVGGVALSVALWAWERLHLSSLPLDDFGVLTAIALGTGFWLLRQPKTVSPPRLTRSELNPEIVETEIKKAQSFLTLLEQESVEPLDKALLERIKQLPSFLEDNQVKIGIAGARYTGKTTLKQLLEANLKSDPLTLEIDEIVSTAFSSPSDTTTSLLSVSKAIHHFDVVLYLIDGDLTESQWHQLQALRDAHQIVFLLLNKQDRYLPAEKTLILEQVKQRVQGRIEEAQIYAIATQPCDLKVRQHQGNGEVKEWLEQQPPQIEPLLQGLDSILTHEPESLKLAKTWRKTIALQGEIRQAINQIRCDLSLPLIEKYQWLSAGTTFANPVAGLDLLATVAINGQLILDLSKIYQQKLSLAQAKQIATTLGEALVKLGVVEISTQTVTHLLKSHAFTYVAGGVIQGISASYLTRLAGLTLIAYYQEQDLLAPSISAFNLETLNQKLKQVFQDNQRLESFKSLIQQALKQKPFASLQS